MRFTPYAARTHNVPVVSLPRLGHERNFEIRDGVPFELAPRSGRVEYLDTSEQDARSGLTDRMRQDRNEWSRVIDDNFFRDVFSFDIFGSTRPIG